MFKRVILFFDIILFISCVFIYAAPARGILFGNIAYSDAQSPVDATIEIYVNSKLEYVTFTDNTGYFSVTLTTGTYDLRVIAAGYEPQKIYSVIVSSGQVTNLNTIVLTKLLLNKVELSDSVFDLEKMSMVELVCQINSVTDLNITVLTNTGKTIRTLSNGTKEPGTYCMFWNGKTDTNELAGSGTYFIRVRTGNSSQLKKIVLLR
jgi:hypothetical protein